MRGTMRRFIIGIWMVATAAVTLPAQAEEEEKKIEVGRWYNNVETGLNLTQSAYSDNWKGGGNSSLAWTAFFNGGLQKKFHNKLHWANTLRLRFGQTHTRRERSDGTTGWEKPEKTEDKIDFETLLLRAGEWAVEPYASARWQSFFLDEDDPFGRDIVLNPNTFRESIGAARHLMEQGKEEFVLGRFGATARQNFRRFFVDPVSDDKDNSFAVDGGLELQLDWRVKIFKEKLAWRGKIDVYQPFWWSEASTFDEISPDSLIADGIDPEVKDYTTVVDVGWENTFTTQITKWIAFNIYVEFVYDKYDNSVVPIVDDSGALENPAQVSDAIRKSLQWKQTFGVGLTINLGS